MNEIPSNIFFSQQNILNLIPNIIISLSKKFQNEKNTFLIQESFESFPKFDSNYQKSEENQKPWQFIIEYSSINESDKFKNELIKNEKELSQKLLNWKKEKDLIKQNHFVYSLFSQEQLFEVMNLCFSKSLQNNHNLFLLLRLFNPNLTHEDLIEFRINIIPEFDPFELILKILLKN
ncbi:hypothetical protein M0811_13848 [Anaeramoeba ignava]|uniref:Uncharacterized protein n=1 Tax=Anaeramoeba ignava TaxID=1746090 RepID=A0A9Q0RHZ4_ANAIG|nr:hypothetical protein M0811_13848 [Anaeramoeba ignava]